MEALSNEMHDNSQMLSDHQEGLGAEEHQGSGVRSLYKQSSQVGLYSSKKSLTILKPVLLEQQQSSLPPKLKMPKTTTNKNYNSTGGHQPRLSDSKSRRNHANGLSGNYTTVASGAKKNPQYSMLNKKILDSQQQNSLDEDDFQELLVRRNHSSNKRTVTTQAGIKLKQQPPALPKTFEQSPLFDTGVSSQYFRLQPGSQQPAHYNSGISKEQHHLAGQQSSITFDKTLKVAQESTAKNQGGASGTIAVINGQQNNTNNTNQGNNKSRFKPPTKPSTNHTSPKAGKKQQQLLQNAQRAANQELRHQQQIQQAAAVHLQENFSLKMTTNKDQFGSYQIETVSDAFTTVELKKVSRELQKTKRLLRENRDRQKDLKQSSAGPFQKKEVYQDNDRQQQQVQIQMLDLDYATNGFTMIQEVSVAGEKSPLSAVKSKQPNNFENQQFQQQQQSNSGKRGKAPMLRKTSTMVKSPKRHQKQIVSSRRNEKQVMKTDQEMSSNDIGYASAHNSILAKNLQMQQKLQIGSNKISQVDKRRRTPDSRSYSIDSINSIEDHMREQMKKSLDQKNFGSQSSTLDLGLSMSKSKMSVNRERQSKDKILGKKDDTTSSQHKLKLGVLRSNTISPNQKLVEQNFNRQRTFGSTSLSPTDRGQKSSINVLKMTDKVRKSKRLDNSDKHLHIFKGLNSIGDGEQRSLQSRQSKHYQKEQTDGLVFNERENREQRIFDVYMKAPYQVMDASKQKRQNLRQQLKHLQFIQSPSKEKLAMEGTHKTSADGHGMMDMTSNNKRTSLPTSTKNLLQTGDNYNSSRKFRLAQKQQSVENNNFNSKASKTQVNQRSNENFRAYETHQTNDHSQGGTAAGSYSQKGKGNKLHSTLRFAQAKKQMQSTLPASLGNSDRGSTIRSPKKGSNGGKQQQKTPTTIEKQGTIDTSVSYLQQVFIQRKHEEELGKAQKNRLPTNKRSDSHLAGKHKSMSVTQHHNINLLNDQSNGNNSLQFSPIQQNMAQDKKNSMVAMGKTGSPIAEQRTNHLRDFSANNSKMDKSDRERKNSPSQLKEKSPGGSGAPNNQWAEEQKANVKQAYLRPFKLMKTGEVIQQPQTKTVKGGRLVGLPHVNKPSKEQQQQQQPTMFHSGSDNMLSHNSSSRAILMQEPSQNQTPLLVMNSEQQNRMLIATQTNNTDEAMLATIGSDRRRDRHAGEIINLQLGNKHAMMEATGSLGSRRSSGQFRYLEEDQNEDQYENGGNVDNRYAPQDTFVVSPNATFSKQMLNTNSLQKDDSRGQLKAQLKQKLDSNNEQAGKYKMIKPSNFYPTIYGAQSTKNTRNGNKNSVPWVNRALRHEQSQRRINAQEEQQAGADEMNMTLGTGAGQLTISHSNPNQFNTVSPSYKKSHSMTRPQENKNKIYQKGSISGIKPHEGRNAKNLGKTQHYLNNPDNNATTATQGFSLPPALQTTSQYSPDFPQVVKRDTRPTFLGGQYTSKVKGKSEVSQYINSHGRQQQSPDFAATANQMANEDPDEYNVQSYYKAKLRMRNSIERAFASQVHQYHHEYKGKHQQRNAIQNKNLTWQCADQGDLELPQISTTPNKNNITTSSNVHKSGDDASEIHLPPSQ